MSIKHFINGEWKIVPGTTSPGIKPKIEIVNGYWKVDGEFLLDEYGYPISALGMPGEDGIDGKTPSLKIENDYWYVSYDNGTTWVQFSKATGEDGRDGADGNSPYISENGNWCIGTVDTGISAKGVDGIDGKDGKDGINGADGIDGKDGISIVWHPSSSSHPEDPENGYAYYNSSEKASYVYQDGSWYQMSVDGIDGSNGENGQDGLSITWKGDLESAPENPEINWCYRDTDNKCIYIYNGTGWELLIKDGNDGVDGTNGKDGQDGIDGKNGADGEDGEDGMSVFITYNNNLPDDTPNTPTGDGTSDGWHTNATANSVWISQKVSKSPTEGEWGAPIRIVGKDGVNGSPGERGRLIYSAGEWNADSSYKLDDNTAPYVEHSYLENETSVTKYFVLIKDVSSVEAEPQNDKEHWEEMTSFNSIFTDLIVAKYGTVGGAVFYNDDYGNYFMFSKSGVEGGLRTPTDNYKQFLKNVDGSTDDISKIKTIFGLERWMTGSLFKPNMLINLTTGDAWFGQGALIVSNDRRSYINGQIVAATDIAAQTFYLGVDDNSLVIDGRNIELYNNMSLNNQSVIMFIGGTVASDSSGDQISYDQTLGWSGNQSAIEDANVTVTYSDTEHGGLKFIAKYNSDLQQILKENFKYRITLKNAGSGVIAFPYTLSDETQVPLYVLPNESIDYMLSVSTTYEDDGQNMELIGAVVSEVSIIDGVGKTKLNHGGYDIYTNLINSEAKLVDGTLTYTNDETPTNHYCCVLKRTNRGSVNNSGEVIC